MPGDHARIPTALWKDEQFCQLSSTAQWLYLVLLTHPRIDHAGFVPLQARQWAHRARGTTAEHVRAGLAELAAQGFVGVDYDTEEVVVRGYATTQGITRQPQMMNVARREAAVVESPLLRAALAVDLGGLDSAARKPTNPTRKQFYGSAGRRRLRAEIAADLHVCSHCGSADALVVDHIIPIDADGTNSEDNLQVLCTPCNGRKGARV